jgi:hypothetical protein
MSAGQHGRSGEREDDPESAVNIAPAFGEDRRGRRSEARLAAVTVATGDIGADLRFGLPPTARPNALAQVGYILA